MVFNQENLPYYYETEQNPETLDNGVQRQPMWHYSVAQTAQVSIQGIFQPLLVENVQQVVRYTFDDYRIDYMTVHEWQYIDTVNLDFTESVYGYRFYRDGSVTKSGKQQLQPEAAVMLGYTPEPETIPAYIEMTPHDELKSVLQRAATRLQDSGTLNAWLSPPIDAPRDAPQDINQVLKRVRADIGIKTQRGRGRLIQYLTDETGVHIGKTGWSLTPKEYIRRQGTAANA